MAQRREGGLDPSDISVHEVSSFGTATILTGIASFVALIFSGLSLYQTVLKQAKLHLYVPETIGYTRDPNGSYEVFAIPVTVANSGARDGIVSSLKLNVRNTATGTERQLSASFIAAPGYYSTKEDYSKGQSRPKTAFAPISVPGRSGYTGTVLFYPKEYSEIRAVPGAGTYDLTLTAQVAAIENMGTIDQLWSTTIEPVKFSAKLPAVSRFFKGQMLSGKTVRMFVDRSTTK